jgi:hypothetical protein
MAGRVGLSYGWRAAVRTGLPSVRCRISTTDRLGEIQRGRDKVGLFSCCPFSFWLLYFSPYNIYFLVLGTVYGPCV